MKLNLVCIVVIFLLLYRVPWSILPAWPWLNSLLFFFISQPVAKKDNTVLWQLPSHSYMCSPCTTERGQRTNNMILWEVVGLHSLMVVVVKGIKRSDTAKNQIWSYLPIGRWPFCSQGVLWQFHFHKVVEVCEKHTGKKKKRPQSLKQKLRDPEFKPCNYAHVPQVFLL